MDEVVAQWLVDGGGRPPTAVHWPTAANHRQWAASQLLLACSRAALTGLPLEEMKTILSPKEDPGHPTNTRWEHGLPCQSALATAGQQSFASAAGVATGVSLYRPSDGHCRGLVLAVHWALSL